MVPDEFANRETSGISHILVYERGRCGGFLRYTRTRPPVASPFSVNFLQVR